MTSGNRSDEVTSTALYDGIVAGALALVPSTAAVYYAMHNPKFIKSTNWQSRTALSIMPALFAFALASENKVNHRIQELKSETSYAREVSDWAEKKHEHNKQSMQRMETNAALEKQLHDIYQQSVKNSGVRIVEGDSIGVHHRIANFWQENPFKILAGVGVPSVLYIFSGRKGNLQLQSKLMHTRVYGQFFVVSMLLGLMGFKTYMDSMGKYISQKEADTRVDEMKTMRADLLRRIEFDKKMSERRQQMLNNEKKTEDVKYKSKKQKSSEKVDVLAIEDA
jgi:hypothetical protein